MQLILNSEPALAIERKMSAVDEIHNEKVGNGDIEKLNGNNCNGNKENIAEDNIITNEEVNKQVINTEVEVLTNSLIETKSENTEVESSTDAAIKEETCENNIRKVNNEHIEESQMNGTGDEENFGTITNESDEKPKEIVEDEEDIIAIKEENVNNVLDIAEKVPENVDATTAQEDLPSTSTQDDVKVIEQPTETHAKCEIASDVDLEIQANTPENKDKQLDDSNNVNAIPDCDSTQVTSSVNAQDSLPIELKDDMEVEEIVEATKSNEEVTVSKAKETTPTAPVSSSIVDKPILCKLSNTLDILSDDEDEPPNEEPPKVVDTNEKQCINIEDDDDIMLIDEDTSKTEKPEIVDISNKEEPPISTNDDKTDSETGEKTVEETVDLFAKNENEEFKPADVSDSIPEVNLSEKQEENEIHKFEPELPLLPENFLKTAKKDLSDMTREDLEEFCILKIVESIVDRSNLSEIKNKLKTVAQGIEEYRKKAMMLTKQNRDLQVVLKSIQEEQKKMTPDTPITPLKITRSVGMQVFMEKTGARRKNLAQLQAPNNSNATNRQNMKTASLPGNTRLPKTPVTSQAIPVPRLVPANNPAMKSPSTIPLVNQITPIKAATPMPNGVKNPSPSQKVAEKRQHNRIMSVTVDLTDDEPPTKINNRTSPAPPVRVVPSQNLMANPRQQFATSVSSPRKVYIPISGPQNQGLRPGQTIMLKTVPTPGLRPRCPTPQVARVPTGSVRVNRLPAGRHPAPLPDAMKQYQPPNWKALPPAPDLKLSKVENGIVISWKIEGYQEDSYEEIASYQLYAYQETSSPPSTTLWKKIGDVKALPLPMACTLTQFMAGFKYYFAVRAVDIRSRLGPFSLPGSILLLNKL